MRVIVGKVIALIYTATHKRYRLSVTLIIQLQSSQLVPGFAMHSSIWRAVKVLIVDQLAPDSSSRSPIPQLKNDCVPGVGDMLDQNKLLAMPMPVQTTAVQRGAKLDEFWKLSSLSYWELTTPAARSEMSSQVELIGTASIFISGSYWLRVNF